MCAGFIRMKEFYCMIVLVSCIRNLLNAQEKFVYLLRYENREVAKCFEKLTTSVNTTYMTTLNTTYTNNVYFLMYCAIGNLLSLLNVMACNVYTYIVTYKPNRAGFKSTVLFVYHIAHETLINTTTKYCCCCCYTCIKSNKRHEVKLNLL